MKKIFRSSWTKRAILFAFVVGLLSHSTLAQYVTSTGDAGVPLQEVTTGYVSQTGNIGIPLSQLQAQAVVAPQIMNLTVSPLSYVSGTSTTNFSLNTEAKTTVWVKDSQNRIVKTLLFDITLLPNQTYTYTWDGLTSNDVKAAPGNYKVEVVSYNSIDSDVKSQAFTVIEQVTPPPATDCDIQATNHYFSPYVINPSSSNNNESKLRFSLNTAANARVEIYSGTTLVRSLVSADIASGNHEYTWNARNNSGNLVSDGTYTYNIITNKANCSQRIATGNVKVERSDTPATCDIQATNHYFSPYVINPSSSNNNESKLRFSLNTAANARVEIYSGTTLVRSLVSADIASGNHEYTWNARNNSGNLVSDGTYTYNIITNKANCSQRIATGNVKVERSDTPYYDDDKDYTGNNNTYPIENDWEEEDDRIITGLKVEPNLINPFKNESVKITFDLDQNVDRLKVQIVDGNRVVRSLADRTNQSRGTYTFYWDGLDRYGDKVNDGRYSVRVMADTGSKTDTDRVCVAADSGGVRDRCQDEDKYENDWPSTNENLIINMLVDNEIFNPSRGERARLNFEITNNLKKLVVQVVDRDNKIIRTLRSSSEASRGKYSFYWDGRNADGRIVRDDVYQFRVMADDGRDTDTDRAYTEVDTDGIIIGFPMGARCAGYKDVSIHSPFCKAIELMSAKEIFKGYPDGTFRPYLSINRAETVKVVILALGYDVDENLRFGKQFLDTQANVWYTPFLEVALRNGVINGYPDGTFRPTNTINRVELLKVFLEAHNLSFPICNNAPYSDTPINADTAWYIKYACYAKMYGLMNVSSNNLFPSQAMSRGDVADLFYNFDRKGEYSGYDKGRNDMYGGSYSTYDYDRYSYDNNRYNDGYYYDNRYYDGYYNYNY